MGGCFLQYNVNATLPLQACISLENDVRGEMIQIIPLHYDVSSPQYNGSEWGGDPDRLLKQRESLWISTLQTFAPKGLKHELFLNVTIFVE